MLDFSNVALNTLDGTNFDYRLFFLKKSFHHVVLTVATLDDKQFTSVGTGIFGFFGNRNKKKYPSTWSREVFIPKKATKLRIKQSDLKK